MKKIALILMLLTLPFTAQATTHYKTTLVCKWSHDIVETYVLDGEWSTGIHPHNGWTVKRITQRPYSIEVRIDGPKGETLNIDFNNGWPCKVLVRQKPVN